MVMKVGFIRLTREKYNIRSCFLSVMPCEMVRITLTKG
jgi:hypothetical protein